MDIKAGYKLTEVGVIPSDWELVTLGELGNFKNGINKGKEEFGHGNPFVNLLDVFGKNYIDNSIKLGLVNSNENERLLYSLKKGDVIFVRSSVKPSGVGLTILCKDDLTNAVFSGFLIRFRDNGKIYQDYKIHCFYEEGFRQRLISNSTVNANTNINQVALKALLIPLPPTQAEQTTIATALSDADQYIAHLEKLIAKKRLVKQGAMQELLRPKEGWKTMTYGEIFDFLTTASYSRADLTDTDEICYVHYGDIHTKWNSFLDFAKNNLPTISKDKLKNYPLLKEGDIIMADASEDYSGVGESVEVKNLENRKAISGLHTFLLRDKKGIFANGFKGYIHKSKIVKNQIETLASGLKVYGISKYNLKSVQIPIPPIEVQVNIAKLLSDMDAEIVTLETKLSKAQSIKQGMMQQLLTGKIRLM